jgi:hypothetical protein
MELEMDHMKRYHDEAFANEKRRHHDEMDILKRELIQVKEGAEKRVLALEQALADARVSASYSYRTIN